MDLRHVLRVLQARKRFVLLGLTAAVVCTVLSYASPAVEGGLPTLKPRGTQTWLSEAILQITERGFPEGRAVPEYRASDPRRGTPAVLVGDQDRLASLAALFSQYATSDRVRSIALRKGPLDAEVTAEPVTYTTTQFAYPQVLPLIRISSTATSPGTAIGGARRISQAFITYVRGQQAAAAIAGNDRVVVDYTKKPTEVALIKGRSKILPSVVFFALLTLVVGAALVMDNLARAGQADAHQADAATDGELESERVVTPVRATALSAEAQAVSARRGTLGSVDEPQRIPRKGRR